MNSSRRYVGFIHILFLQTDTILVSGDHVIAEWTLQTNLIEPFYGAHSRKVRVALQGASIVRTDKGMITD